MSTLRKACTNCTNSKRKCVIQKPKCVRCSRKNLDCVYSLDPLKAPPTEYEKHRQFGFKLSNSNALGVCILRALKNGSQEIDPAICLPGCENSLELTRLGYNTVLGLIRAQKPASFVHPKLQLSGIRNHFTSLVENGATGVTCADFKSLVETDIRMVSLKETLTALQALLIHMAASVFSSVSTEREEADKSFGTLFEWTQALLTCVDAGISKSQSPWQDWLLRESVRRTIFMAYALKMSVNGYKHGYCSHWLFVESLPFDSRPGLWMAESPQAWIASARARSGEEVGDQLNSFHEFAESLAHHGQALDLHGDIFLTLLKYAHNGLGGN